jgi:hypothetical protein
VSAWLTVVGRSVMPQGQRAAWAATPTDQLPPHIFAIAERAWRRLVDEPTCVQAFVVNGESGAGKTEACRQLMRYIAEASAEARGAASPGGTAARRGSGVATALETSMLEASCVLESFGNAKTIRNANSSRFGKARRRPPHTPRAPFVSCPTRCSVRAAARGCDVRLVPDPLLCPFGCSWVCS